MLNRGLLSFIIGVLLSICIAPSSHALWWMGYHKPAFHGKVIDAETKEPIEGAVVVVVYSKKSIGIAESYSVTINVREVLTDKDGDFYIPSYSTIIQPLSWESSVSFIIFKPGYGSFPDWRVSPSKGSEVHFEEFFSRDFGLEKEVLWSEPWKTTGEAEHKLIKVTFGIVELPPLKTREERLRVIPGISGDPSYSTSENLPLFYKLINEEYKRFGLQEVK